MKNVYTSVSLILGLAAAAAWIGLAPAAAQRHEPGLPAADAHPGGREAEAQTALDQARASFCQTDAGYPDCLAHEIKLLEKWLADYPDSRSRPEVMFELAGDYLSLADRFGEDAPWRSDTRASLLRGHALIVLAEIAQDRGHADIAFKAGRLYNEALSSGASFSLTVMDLEAGRILPPPAGV